MRNLPRKLEIALGSIGTIIGAVCFLYGIGYGISKIKEAITPEREKGRRIESIYQVTDLPYSAETGKMFR